ncbi:trypsin-like peptidase domain-containing protein [Streptomyces sp. SAS_270]|uniref:trypsin-like peptidase domain-containing protein n=1 Tax=Streptomyces sp. SAS_270 TaxID=3412748 RepID=UPI00403CD0E2
MGPERGQVRVLSPDGALWGAGVLVAPEGATVHVLTCAHVVTAAIGGPSGQLLVDLPGRAWSATARLLPDSWSPAPAYDRPVPGADCMPGADFAVLALDAQHPQLPRGCGPLPLAQCDHPSGQRVAVIGYPRGVPAGLIATARLTGGGGPCPDWVQLDGLRATGALVEHGFSGAAVWDPARQRVIGLITAAHTDRSTKVAWMLPVEVALHLWPPLVGAVRPPGPRPCTPPPLEHQYELADALLDVPQIGYDSGRALRSALPAAVRRNIPDHAFPRQQLQAVVQTCTDHHEGCPILRAAVLNLGGGSVSAHNALEILDRICCTGEQRSGGGG